MLKSSKIFQNTLLLYIKSFIVLLLTLYTSRKVLEILGVEDFGLYNVVGGVVGMLSFLNTTLVATYQRYFNYEKGRNNRLELKTLFGSSLSVQFVLALIIILLAETFGLWFLKTQLVIPVERMQESVWVYHISIASFAISMLQAPFQAMIIAYERMDMFAIVAVIESLLKLAVVLVLPMFAYDSLVLYAAMILGTVIISTVIYIVWPSIKFDVCQFRLNWDKHRFKTLLNFGAWGTFDSLSYTLKSQGLNILLNMFFGPVVNAARGLAYQIMNAVNQFVTNFQTSFRPQIIQLYAAGELDAMYKLYYAATKISFYMIWCLSLPIMLNISSILNFWLGRNNVPEYTESFTILVLLTTIISAYANPTSCVAYAIGRIKWFTIVVSGLNILILPVAYVVLRLGAAPQYALVVSLIITILAQVARLFVVKYLETSFSLRKYLVFVVKPTLVVATTSMIVPFALKFYDNESIYFGILACAVAVISVLLCVLMFGLNQNEKELLLGKARQLLHKQR